MLTKCYQQKSDKQMNKTKNFFCAKCDYTTSKKSDWLKHIDRKSVV